MGLDSVLLILEIELEFGIEIPNEVAERIHTVDDLEAVIRRLLAPIAPPDERDVSRRLRRILIEELGVEEQRIRSDARIVSDLGIN